MPFDNPSDVIRNFNEGMGRAVAERTILRKKPNGAWESWNDVAARVSFGNSLLIKKHRHDDRHFNAEFDALYTHLAKATILMSGRHLQHGDQTQPDRNLEVFTNCSTAPASFLSFLLLMNGSGVGRAYDNDMILVNWDNAPDVRCVLDTSHADFDWSAHEPVRDARHKYRGRDVTWHTVEDSREGWAKALEIWETMAFERVHKDTLLVLDFSKVRAKGAPIRGMQNRPASGPVPLMNAFMKAASIKGAGLEPWLQALFVDHYFAECVLVGGARRAARMSTKSCWDENVIDFVRVKRPIEYSGMDREAIIRYRQEHSAPPAFLWSSNNSVTVDAEFWRLKDAKLDGLPFLEARRAKHARRVFNAIVEASYADGTGEPGLINVDQLVQNDEGWRDLRGGDYVGSEKYQVEDETKLYLARLAKTAVRKRYHMITNPCGEIALSVIGGYCVIADVVPFHADTLDEAEAAFRVATRALMRCNLMDSLYRGEVARTNRIGVGMTGVHEFAFKFFGYGFRELVAMDGDEPVAKDFWETLARFGNAVKDEAEKYARFLGVTVPHTNTTIKPAGTTSKLFGLTEGWHLPAMAWYLRWVQFRNDDPLVQQYREKGYPIRELTTYRNVTIVGFPTEPTIAALGMGDKLVLAGDATPEEQYRWLMLGERYYIDGGNKSGTGNQISYTLKYRPARVGFSDFRAMIARYQPHIRACSVMPQEDGLSYEYLPESPLTKAEYEGIRAAIKENLEEDIGREHVDCGTGGCPIDIQEGTKSAVG